MTAGAFPMSVLGRASTGELWPMGEPETPRLIVLSGGGDVSEAVAEMCLALEIEVEVVASHHDLPFRLHHLRPVAVISELEPSSLANCAALRSIAAYDADMPVLLVAGDDPTVLGTIDAAEKLWRLSNLHRLPRLPEPGDLIRFLFTVGREAGFGRLIPV